MKKTGIILIVVSLGINFHVNGQTLSLQQIKTIESQVDSSFQKMLTMAEQFEYDKMNQGVDDRHKAGFLVNGNYYSDYSTLIAAVKTGAQGVSYQKLELKKKKITVLHDGIALLIATGTSQVKLDDGREFTGDFYWSFVYEKIDGDWKVIQSHQSRGR